MRRRLSVAWRALLAVAAVLVTAPFWAAAVGLGARSLPAPGASIAIPSGHRVNVIDEGAGPPVVLVHGLPGSAYDWSPLPERLVAAGLRVIRYDRIGYGYSDRRTVDAEHRVETNARELVELVSTLGLESPVLVGWSYGGGVVLRAAADAPDVACALLLVGSMGPSTDIEGAAKLGQAVEPLRRWGIASGFPARFGIRAFARTAFSGVPPDWFAGHALSVLAAPGALHTWTVEAVLTDGGALRPERVSVPVTIVHGSSDRLSSPAIAEDLHRRLLTSELVMVAGGSHMLPNTHPALIVDRLRKLTRAEGRTVSHEDLATPFDRAQGARNQ